MHCYTSQGVLNNDIIFFVEEKLCSLLQSLDNPGRPIWGSLHPNSHEKKIECPFRIAVLKSNNKRGKITISIFT